MKKFLLLTFAFFTSYFSYTQPTGYAFRLQSNSNFGTAYLLSNNTPATGILSTTVQAASTASEYLVEWDNYANKWSNTSTTKNQETTLTWGGGNFNGQNGVLNGGFVNGKFYTLQIKGLSYSNRQAALMETDNAPVTISSVTTFPASVNRSQAVTVTVNLSGNKSTQEKAFVRYSTASNFGTSFISDVSFASGTSSTGTATIPSSFNTAGATIYFYAYTTTVSATNSSDHDLISLKISGPPTSYTVASSYISVSSGNWSDGATWAGGAVPPENASVIVDHSVTLNQAASVAAIRVNSGKTFTGSDALPRTLTINSNTSATTLTVNGTFVTGTGGSTVYFSGTPSGSDAIHTVSGSIAFNSVTIGKAGGASNLGVNFGSSTITGTLKIDNGGFVSGAPASFYQSSASLVFNNSGGYNINSGDITWPSINSPNNISIQSGNVNLNSARSADGNLTINGGNFSIANGITLSIKGNWLRTSGTFTANQSTVVLNGTSLQTIQGAGGSVLYNLTINNSAGIGLNSNLSVTNALSITTGKLNIGANTTTLHGIFSGSGTNSFAGSKTSNLVIGSAYTGGSLFFSSSSEENYLNSLTVNAGVTIGNTLNIAPSTDETTGFLAVNSGMLNSAGFLVLKSDATGTARVAPVNATGTISGNVTVERFIGTPAAKRAWRLITAPLRSTSGSDVSIFESWQNAGNNMIAGNGTLVTGTVPPTTANGLDGQSPSGSLREFGTQALVGVNDTKAAKLFTTASSAANKGYFIFVRAGRTQALSATGTTTLQATGALQTGNQIFNTVSGANNFTLIGNPYASPVDFDLLRQANTAAFTPFGSSPVLNNFYYWDPKTNGSGAYTTVSYDGTGTSYTINHSGSRIIQSGQAIFLRNSSASAGGTPITFSEAHKSSTVQNTAFRMGSQLEKLQIDLNLKNADETFLLTDGIIARYNNIYSTAVGYDDAEKLMNIDENLGFKRDGQVLSIEGRPLVDDSDTLFLQMTNLKAGRTYRFNINATGFDAPSLTAFLEDKYLNTSTPISLTGETMVNFSLNNDAASSGIDRFMVVYKTSGVLPISFTHVKASEKGSNIQVEWNLGNEAGIAKYEVERSADGRTFTKTATQQTRATAGGSQPYAWLDVAPISGNNFYRIKAVELSGLYKYSEVVKVKLGSSTGSISVYPNPVKGNNLGLQFVNQPVGKYSIQLFNNLGQEVYRSELNHIGGSATQVILLTRQVAKGIYQMQVTSGDTKTTSKVIFE